jgi:hypothetical protein
MEWAVYLGDEGKEERGKGTKFERMRWKEILISPCTFPPVPFLLYLSLPPS